MKYVFLVLLSLCVNLSAVEINEDFSFVVFGDSRTVGKLPPSKDQIEGIQKGLINLYDILVGEKVDLKYIKEKVELTFDPITNALTNARLPLAYKPEIAYLTIDDGWITEASVENPRLLPGIRKTIYRICGGEWVARSATREVRERDAKFIINSGDLVLWGHEGYTPATSPYWSRFYEQIIDQLPPADPEMLSNNLYGRFFPSIGNHDIFEDPKLRGVLNAAPYLKRLGLSSEKLIYKFDFRGARFIFLWTGPFNYREPSAWSSSHPAYKAQMKQLQEWLEGAVALKIKKVFITFHNPVFARSGFGGIPEKRNPHTLISSFAGDLDIVVFNGHIHTTEFYEVDGVKYLVLGGGGAEQDPNLPGRSHLNLPKGYPRDLYWGDKSRQEDYNYVIVNVSQDKKTTFLLKRFRPIAAKAFESVSLFK